MKTQIKQPQSVSHTIQGKTRAANQASVQRILQKASPEITQRESLPEEDELLQGKFDTAQREEMPEEDELLQGKFKVSQRVETPSPLERAGGEVNNTGLPDNLKSGIEGMSGFSMDAVRVHYNSPKPAQLQALAYTQGTDIYVAPGQEKHLPHEAWHVVQQMQGRVQPTMQLQGVNINDNEGLEKEADVMGGRAIPCYQNANHIIQKKKVLDDHVADDLNHIEANRLFKRDTIRFFQNLQEEAEINEDLVRDNREQVDYEQLRNSTFQNNGQLINWLKGSGEHLYVHCGDSINIASRGKEKLPHPTLVGGDPNAKSAGTMYMYGKDVHITRLSGHFRPSKVDKATEKIVKDIHKSKGGKVIIDESV